MLKDSKSRLPAAMGRKKLRKLLGCASLFDLLTAIWHVDRMQADNPDAALFFKGLPREAITKDPKTAYFVHKWLLESLLTAYFGSSPSKPKANQRFRILQLDQWETVRQLVNLLLYIEDAESAVMLNDNDIMLEMYRIIQRQFPWQRGFATKRILYRSMRLYRTPETMERFLLDTGIALDDFVNLGFLYWAHFKNSSCAKANLSFEKFGIDDATRDLFLYHISDDFHTAAQHARQSHFRKFRMAHRPSRLRTHPMVRLENDLGRLVIAPLIDLVFLRVTQGMFFDFVKHDDLREIIADRFVAYCVECFERGKCSFDVLEEERYKKGQNIVRSPDLFLAQKGLVSAAIECKARRMSHQAQFGEDPTEQAKSGFAEIAKGMTQLWRYLADADAGLLPEKVAPNAETRLVLLTYDSWVEAPFNIQPAVTVIANNLADNKGIAVKFRRSITFLTVMDLEHIAEHGEADQVLNALDGQLTKKYEHWSASTIFDDLHGKLERKNVFTDEDILKVAPWFHL